MARSPKFVAPTPRNVAPAPGQSWQGYWAIITAMIVLMLVVYTASNGQLARWIGLLAYDAPRTVVPEGAEPVASKPDNSLSGDYALPPTPSFPRAEGFLNAIPRLPNPLAPLLDSIFPKAQ